MKLFTFTIALLCASAAVFAEETTTVAPTTLSPNAESSEASTEPPTTIAPETKAEGENTETTTVPASDKETESNKPVEGGEQPVFGGRTGGNFFPHPQDPRVMFVPQTVRDPITGMIYHRRVPHFGPPNPNFRPPMQAPQQPSFDPLGSFSEHQKKRQFFQDLLMTQLSRFEKEVDPMMEHETEEQGKAALVAILEAVHNLKKALDSNQIFNISEIMKTWKEGKLPGQNAAPAESSSANPNEVAGPVTTPAQAEQGPSEVVAVAEASPPVQAILILPQRQREPTLLLRRQQAQHPMYIRRFAVPSGDEQNLPPRGYAPQEHGYIAGY